MITSAIRAQNQFLAGVELAIIDVGGGPDSVADVERQLVNALLRLSRGVVLRRILSAVHHRRGFHVVVLPAPVLRNEQTCERIGESLVVVVAVPRPSVGRIGSHRLLRCVSGCRHSSTSLEMLLKITTADHAPSAHCAARRQLAIVDPGFECLRGDLRQATRRANSQEIFVVRFLRHRCKGRSKKDGVIWNLVGQSFPGIYGSNMPSRGMARPSRKLLSATAYTRGSIGTPARSLFSTS